MTVAAPNCRNDYVGTGATATYPYTFRIFDETHLRVYRRTAAGVLALLVLTTDYTVTGVGDVNGGNVVLVAGNLESLADLSIRRVLPLTQ